MSGICVFSNSFCRNTFQEDIMKYITKKILSFLMILAVLFVFTACSQDPTETTGSSSSSQKENATTGTSDTTSSEESTQSSETTRSEESSQSSETTDTEQTTSSTEESTAPQPHEHVFGEWNVTKKVTCTEDGTQERACACGEKETRPVKASGHVIQTVSGKEPTCTEQGFTEGQTCSVCKEILKKAETIPEKGHAWDEGVITKAPTETETGIRTYTCGTCKETKTSEIPVLAHTHKYESRITAPTCTEHGYTTYTCSCGDSYVDGHVSAKGHTEAVWEGKAATCTESGLTNGKKCSACGKILLEQETVSPLGHSWGEGVITKNPTETETGIRTYTCKSCGETKTETVAVLSHTHKYQSVVTNPTCTEQGYTTHTCVCGEHYTDAYVSATGHSMGKWTQTKAPTCMEKGSEKRTCANCSHFETKEIEAKGHSYKAVVTMPTCTANGYTTHTCKSCGDSYVDSRTEATGHSMGKWTQTKAPTCTEKGSEKSVCANCAHAETREIAATGHSYKGVVKKPSCTEQGYTTHTCSCGKSYVDSYTEATSHSMGKWTQTKAPTCTEKGSEKSVCANCAHAETREIAAKGHSYKAAVTAPTCTEKGYTTYTCACGSSYKGNEVNAKGHTEKIEKGRAATCLKTGLSDKIFCSVCQAVLQEQTLISKRDHQFTAEGCSACGMTFADDDGYRALAAFRNGAAMQSFYQELDRLAKEFHTGKTDLAPTEMGVAMIGSICEEDFGLTLEEASAVFSFYKNDHPYYFWIYHGHGMTNTNNFALIVHNDYCKAADREKYEKQILDTLKKYLALVKDEDSVYEMALAFHDEIIRNTVYSATSQDMSSVWAHNILGTMTKGNGVCETYAKTFQLLLNCVGVENIYVSGVSDGGTGVWIEHVWNLIQLDDGKWYWCDLTWDDAENHPAGWGIRHDYFCVTDTQNINQYHDGGYGKDLNGNGRLDENDVGNIMESHRLEYTHHLPKRSDTVYDGSLRDTFTVNDLQFAISGYRTVQFVLTMKTGTVDIPETVEYNGVTYTVTSVGRIKADGTYTTGAVAHPQMTVLNLPKTVIYIWRNAVPNS